MKLIAIAVGAAVVVTALVRGGAGEDVPPYPMLSTMAQAADTPLAPPPYAPMVLREPVPASAAEEAAALARAARVAWAFFEENGSPQTGLVSAQPDWAYPTVWDIGSTLAAYYAARGLGYIDHAEYRRRVSALLETMSRARLYDGIAYGRNYDYRTGELVGHDQQPAENGTGYSAIDQGRLLVWLKIVAVDEPELADAAATVAHRLDEARLIKDGYMHGISVTDSGEVLAFQEGRIGYEQYAATGFALWDMNPSNALSTELNATPATVLDVPITGDRRGLDRLTSEPLVLAGLEVGWSEDMREMAWQTLSAQARRFEQTGQMTIVSEDALRHPPHFFYYYCVYCSGEAFTINVHAPGTSLDEPRWISTKAAFGWHALLPSAYTWSALQAVQPALSETEGWSSGVYEGTGESTETLALNTAAVILEAALYRQVERPFMQVAAARED